MVMAGGSEEVAKQPEMMDEERERDVDDWYQKQQSFFEVEGPAASHSIISSELQKTSQSNIRALDLTFYLGKLLEPH